MDLNTEIFYFINNDLNNPVFNAILPNFTHLGGLTFLAILFLILFVITRQNIFNTRKYYGLVKTIVLAIIIMFCITSVLKLVFHMPRPYMILENVKLPPTSFGVSKTADPNSFPSGHSATTAAVVTVIVLKAKEYYEKYQLAIIIMILFLVVIAFSRIYIGMHFPFDVLIGALIGILSGVLAVKILKE